MELASLGNATDTWYLQARILPVDVHLVVVTIRDVAVPLVVLGCLPHLAGSKWVIKQWRQLVTSTTHLAQERLTNIQCSSGSRSFAKEMRALKMRSIVASHGELTTTN